MRGEELEVRKSPYCTYRVRGTKITRVEAFSDAVFGFSATLLVVSLEVPRTYRELEAALKGFPAFGLSFLFLVLIWSAHRGFFRRYGLQDARTTVLNSVLLFVVLFFVYPLKFLSIGFLRHVFGIDASGAPVDGAVELYGTEGETGRLFVIYGLGFVAVFMCFALLYLHALSKRDELELAPREIYDARTMVWVYLIHAGFGALSVSLVLVGWGRELGVVSGWIYGLLGPVIGTFSAIRWRRREAYEAAGG